MLAIVLVTLSSLAVSNCFEGYYWRDYYGVVPGDALVAGTDANHRNVYIGQAYIKNAGLVVVQIKNGTTDVIAPIGGAVKTHRYIKILCGAEEDFFWMKANKTSLHLELTGKRAVPGGQEDTYGVMNIGRTSVDGGTVVGKINSFWPENALFFFINKEGEEKLRDNYEILMYRDEDIDVRIKE